MEGSICEVSNNNNGPHIVEGKDLDVSINNSERLIKQLQDKINFLREQLKNKDKITNSLLQQLSKRDDVLFSVSSNSNVVIPCSVSNNSKDVLTVMVLITLT